jgi:hypothetical protein
MRVGNSVALADAGHVGAAGLAVGFAIQIEIIYNSTGKLDRLLSIGPLYLAIQEI